MLLYHLRRPWALPLLLSLTLLYVTLAAGCSDDATNCGAKPCRQDMAVSADKGARDQAPDTGGDLAEVDLGEADLGEVDLGVDLMASDLPAPDVLVPDTMSSPPDGSSGDGPYVHEDITPQTLDSLLKSGTPLTLLDVREPSELASGKIAGSINKPWISGVLQQDFASIPKNQPVVVICQGGGRSNAAAMFLVGKGFRPVQDVVGGMSAWVGAGYPTVP